MKITKKAVAAGIAGVALLGIAGTSVASADPADGLFRPYAGTGSDTTQDVLNALSEVIVDGSGNKLLASYDTTASGQNNGLGYVQTKNAANCYMTRPVGSGAGRNTLNASIVGGNYSLAANADGTARTGDVKDCVDFGRTSTFPAPTTAFSAGKGAITYAEFAIDGLAYATLNTATVPKNLTKAQLKGIYQCTAFLTLAPLLPTASSGTRQSFLSALGLNSNAVVGDFNASTNPNGLGACVKDRLTGQTADIVENDGTYLTAGNQLVPFSVAQSIGQTTGVQTFLLGRTQLRGIDFGDGNGITSPIQINTTYGATRRVYNALETARISATVSTKPSVINGSGTTAVLELGNAQDIKTSILAGNPVTVANVGAGYNGTIPAASISITGTSTNIILNYPSVGGVTVSPIGSVPASAAVTADSTKFDPQLASIFVGNSSKVCTNGTILKRFGFVVDANCGDTSNKSG